MNLQTHDALPPFIASSVPKSGTHLMHQLLNGIPFVNNRIDDATKKFFVNNPPSGFYEDHDRRLAILKPNEFGIGHLYYSHRYARLIEAHGLKHIFVYRDPRDVLVSLTYFIADHWPEHPLHIHFLKRFVTFETRAAALLQGIPEFPCTFNQYFKPFYGWLNDGTTLHVSFEQLITDDNIRRQALSRILEYLWKGLRPPASVNQMIAAMEANVDSKKSRTFRQGKVGTWRLLFNSEIKNMFKKDSGQLLIDAGYEQNGDW